MILLTVDGDTEEGVCDEALNSLQPRCAADDQPLQLRDYQLLSLNWLTHNWSRGTSCILA